MLTTARVWFETTIEHRSVFAPERHAHRLRVEADFPGRTEFAVALERLQKAWDERPTSDGHLEQVAEGLLLRAGAVAVRIRTEEGEVEARQERRK